MKTAKTAYGQNLIQVLYKHQGSLNSIILDVKWYIPLICYFITRGGTRVNC